MLVRLRLPVLLLLLAWLPVLLILTLMVHPLIRVRIGLIIRLSLIRILQSSWRIWAVLLLTFLLVPTRLLLRSLVPLLVPPLMEVVLVVLLLSLIILILMVLPAAEAPLEEVPAVDVKRRFCRSVSTCLLVFSPVLILGLSAF